MLRLVSSFIFVGLAWAQYQPPGGGGSPTGVAGGDLTGNYPNPGVAKINGTAFAGTTGHVVTFAASNTPADGGTLPTVTGGTCTNQVTTAISTSAVPTCTTVTSAYTNNSIAATGVDINTSNQVMATHLASALPFAQGGLGTSTNFSAHNWFGNNTGSAAAPTASQPACGDLSNSAASCSTDATNAANISSGTLPAGRLPNPSASTLGGVESLASSASKWINQISTSGVPSATQPAFTDLTGSASYAQLPATTCASTNTGGALPCLETHTASNSATLDFTTCIQSGYDDYEFRFANMIPITSTDNFVVQLGTGGGPTWDSGSNYKWALFASNQASGSGASGGGTTDTVIGVALSLATTAGEGTTGIFRIANPASANHKQGNFQALYLQASANMSQADGGFSYQSTTAVTGVRFKMSTGNISSGTIRCYGIAH